MAEGSNQGKAPQQAPAHRGLCGPLSETVDAPDGRDCNQRDEGCGKKGMRDAAMVRKSSDGTAKAPDHVEVRCLCRERHGQSGISGLAVESRTGQDCSGKEMCDRIHLDG